MKRTDRHHEYHHKHQNEEWMAGMHHFLGFEVMIVLEMVLFRFSFSPRKNASVVVLLLRRLVRVCFPFGSGG